MTRIRLTLLLVLATLVLLFAAPVFASNVTVSGTVNFSSLDGSVDDDDHTVNGVFTVNGDLTINGTILCIDDSGRTSACAMSFNVGHDLVINAGGGIFAENRTGSGTGAPIAFTVGHDFVMHGPATTFAGAIVSSDSTSSSGSNGGNITASVGNDFTIESGATIDSGSANAAAGAIAVTAGGHIDASGNVLAGPSRTILSTRLTDAALGGGTGNQIGGAIALHSNSFVQPGLNVGANANIISQGQITSAGPVTLEACGVVVNGLVASLAYKDATSRVAVRSGKSIEVSGGGMLRGDAPTGTAINHTIDLFANNDITISGPPSGSLYAISGKPGVHDSKSDGATVRVISLTGGVTASGNVIIDGHTASGDDGGNIAVSAQGTINLDQAVISTIGDSNTSNPARGGGTIAVRSYSGNVVWTNGTGDVRPVGSGSGLTTGQGSITITSCGTINLAGSTFPTIGAPVGTFPAQTTGVCSPAAPSLPAGEPALQLCCNTITVINPANSTGTAGAAFSETFTQAGAIGTATFSLFSGTLPAGLSLSASGVLSGTPTQVGSFPIVVEVTDSQGCTGVGPTYNLHINCQTITVTNPSTTTAVAASPFSVTFTQSGAIGGATFSTSSALPSGLSLSSAGVLSGTPTQTGTFPIVVTVTDGNGCTGSSNYTLTVTCQTITVTNPANSSGTVGSPFSATFTQSGAIGTAVFSTGSTLPNGLTLSSAGVLSGTPTQVGTFPIVVTVTDSNGCTGSGATYNLHINCQTITVQNPANNSGTVGTPFSAQFTQSGGIGTTTFTTSSTLPNGVTLSSAGLLSGTPTQPGTFNIVVVATDSNGCTGTTTYTLTISCQTITVNNPAVNSGTAGTAFSQQFTQSGGIGTTTFTTSSTLPTGLSLSSAGLLSGTPTQTGTFTIVVVVTDSNGCTGTTTYTLTINCQNITVNNPSTTTGTVDSPFSASFTQSGALVFAHFTVASGTLPAGLTLSSTGLLSGTPTQPGTFTITVLVTDGNGCTGTSAPYTLTIACQPITVTNPSSNTGVYNTPLGAGFTFTQSGGHPPVVFTLNSGALPSGVTLTSAGALTGTPTQTGVFNITVKVTDVNGCTGFSGSYSLTIAPKVTSKVYTDVGNTQLAGGVAAPATPAVIGVALSNGDASDAPIVYAATVLPSHGLLNVFNSNGTFLYTPNVGNTTTDSFTYTATSNGVTVTATATINFSGMVWYVDNTNGGSADGRSNTPFTTLSAVGGAGTSSGDYIYISKGSGQTSGSYTMLSAQQLIGAGATLSVAGVLNVPGAAVNTPTLNGTLTLASNVTVAGIDMSTGISDALVGAFVSGISVTARNVTTTTGVALNITGSSNSGTIALTQVNANGAPSAIVVTNFNGGVSVLGDGGGSSNGSGGSVQNTTGHAVSLVGITGTGVSLNYMNISNSGLNGVNGLTVHNITVNHCNITDAAGNVAVDDGVKLSNASGSVAVTSSSISGSRHQGLTLDNLNTNLSALSLTGTTISGTVGGDGVLVEMRGSSVLTTGTVSGSTFSNNSSTGMQVVGADTANLSSLTLQNNTVSGNNAGFDLDLSQSASMTVNVLTNTFNNQNTHALNLFTSTASTGGTLTAKLQGNLIGTANVFNSGSFLGDGIRVAVNGGTAGSVTIDGNVIREVPNARGIDVDAEGYTAANHLSVKVVNNQVIRPTGSSGDVGCGPNTPCPLGSIVLTVDHNAAASESLCAVVTGNSAYDPTSWPLGAESAYYLARRSLQTFNLEGNTSQTVQQNILNNNTVTDLTNPGVGDFTDESGNVVVVPAGSCGVFP